MAWQGGPEPNPKKDEIGKVYGRLTVKESAGKDQHGNYLWLCQCECGGQKTTRGGHLRNGRASSCGCWFRDLNVIRSKAHAETRTWNKINPRQCTRCLKIRPPDRFECLNKHVCRDCKNMKFKEKVQRRGGWSPLSRLLRYNITEEDYQAMVKNQDGKCYICRKLPIRGKKKILCVDHDHELAKVAPIRHSVRDLLCEFCNKGLGAFEDDPERMERAADYIRRHKEIAKARGYNLTVVAECA